jgi:hypothetical protein
MVYKTLQMDEVSNYVAFLHHCHVAIVNLVVANGIVAIRHEFPML